MIREIKSITAPLTDYPKLKEQGYLCFNVVGIVRGVLPAIMSEVARVTCANAYAQRNALTGKDYAGCSYAYLEILNKSKTKIFNSIKKTIKDSGKMPTKVAWLGIDHTQHNGFNYRTLFNRFFCLHYKSEVGGKHYPKFVDEGIADSDIYYYVDYPHQTNIVINKENTQTLLDECEWVFAKTMPDNPHCYTLRKNWRADDVYLQVAAYIRIYGTLETYYGSVYRCLYLGDYKYWSCPSDTLNSDVDLINRKKIK